MTLPIDKQKVEHLLDNLHQRLLDLEARLNMLEALAVSKTKETIPAVMQEMAMLYREVSNLKEQHVLKQLAKTKQ